MPFTILIVDDRSSVHNLLRFFIEHNPDWQECGEAGNGQVEVEKIRELVPHAVISRFSTPVMNALEAARETTRIVPNVQRLMFTTNIGEQLRKGAQAVGIEDVLSKSDAIGDTCSLRLRTICARPNPASSPVERNAS
jgi:DNA-binding NarL/FixJ family response regulator